MKITDKDLSFITEKAIVYFNNDHKPNTLTDSQYRTMCFAKATVDLLAKKEYINTFPTFPEERNTETLD